MDENQMEMIKESIKIKKADLELLNHRRLAILAQLKKINDQIRAKEQQILTIAELGLSLGE